MTKADIINEVSNMTGLTKVEVEVVLEGINLDVKEGESVVIIGASGAGKSVLLKIILGILEPDVGSIWVDNQPMVGISWKTRESILTKFGMLFQNSALFDSLTVWENVAFGLIEARGINRRKAKSIAVEKLKNVGLGKEVWDLNPAELSGGMKKRVGLARAIATEPEILFFDESLETISHIWNICLIFYLDVHKAHRTKPKNVSKYQHFHKAQSTKTSLPFGGPS